MYIVAVTNASGCTKRDTINVTVNPTPVVALGADTAFCTGNSLTLNAGNPGSTYLWNPGATTGQTRTVTTSGMYSVAVTNASGCVGRDTINVTVNPLPVVNLGNDTTFCAGNSLTLNAGNAGSTYLWNPGATTGQTRTVTTSGTYSVTVTNSNGCTATDNITVTVTPQPVVNLGNDTTVCGNVASLVFNAGNPGSTYAWFPSQGANTQTYDAASVINAADMFGAGSGQNTIPFYVDVTSNGCTRRDSILVTINFTPRVDGILVSGSAPTFTFAPDADSFATGYAWDFGDNSTGSTAQNPTHTYTANGTYPVTLIVSNSCGSDTVTTSVVVTGLGVGTVLSGDLISLFPNPATNAAVIETRGGGLTLRHVQVFNALGVLVMDAPLNSNRETIRLDGFANGIYTVRVQTDKGTIVRRLEVLR
jgi:hypothetical protein